MADGEWVSAPAGDFKNDPSLELIYDNGRPSHFEQKLHETLDPSDAGTLVCKQQASEQPTEHSAGLPDDTEVAIQKQTANVEAESASAISSLDENQVAKLTQLARAFSYPGIRNETGETVNPFFNSEHPLLDPNSGKFSVKAWLETLMSITARDPERYPKGVAGIAYRNLSAYGFGESTDYQKTFGNYPFELLNLAKRLLGKDKKTRIQILRGFDGLVKSGEILVVLGRPGRYVLHREEC